MRTIHKQTLEIADQLISCPAGARFLTAQMQHGKLAIWYECDPDQDNKPRIIVVAGTGHELPTVGTLEHIATVQELDGALVWHVFEVVP